MKRIYFGLTSFLAVMVLLVAAAFLWPNLALTVIVPFVTHHDFVDAGRYRHLQIGQTQEEVLLASKQVPGISHIQPEVDEPITIDHLSLDRLGDLAEAAGISIYKDRFEVEVEFNDEHVTSVRVPPVNQGETLGIAIGQARTDAMIRLLSAMKLDHELRASNFLPNARWVSLATMNEQDIEYLSSFNTWEHPGPGDYSSMILKFSNHRLISVDYKWSDIELP